MAISDEQEKSMEELFKFKLKEQYNRGFHIGILSVSKVVLDELNNGSKPFMKRIEEIKRFCETPWDKQKKIEKALKKASAKAEQVIGSTEISSNDDDGKMSCKTAKKVTIKL